MSAMLPSQRRSKLKASEAALLAGELTKPSWQSRNEGIHERVSFEDSIWGFDLAGGSFYKTPLRVTAVKQGSRADKAGIRPGDKLLRINDIDTSTLTIQEAHEIIIESGVHIRLAVTAPDDTEDSYNCWQDQIEDPYDSEEERRKEKEKAKKRVIHCRTNANWSLQWPWVSKRRIIYKESNCFMVPSKYESKHREKFPEQTPSLKTPEDIVLHSKTSNTPINERSEPEFPEAPQNVQSENIFNSNENVVKEDLKQDLSNVLPNGDINDIKNDFKEKVQQEQMETTEVIDGIKENDMGENGSNEDKKLQNWNPNDVDSAMEEEDSTFDDVLEESVNDQDDILIDDQEKILDEVLNGGNESEKEHQKDGGD